MNLPLSPLTVTAALHLASKATEAITETLDQGANFAQHLFSTPPATTDPTRSDHDVGGQLSKLHRRLVEKLQAAGVDLGFRIDLVSKGDSLTLNNVHPDHQQIEEALAGDSELQKLFASLQREIARTNQSAASQGSFRLQFKANELSFDFGG